MKYINQNQNQKSIIITVILSLEFFSIAKLVKKVASFLSSPLIL
jgi:hypothetical protein